MEYMILSMSDKDNFTNLINQMLKQGWKPQGGVSIAYELDDISPYAGDGESGFSNMCTSNIKFAQAMIKEDKS